jgi:hypothetical protein
MCHLPHTATNPRYCHEMFFPSRSFSTYASVEQHTTAVESAHQLLRRPIALCSVSRTLALIVWCRSSQKYDSQNCSSSSVTCTNSFSSHIFLFSTCTSLCSVLPLQLRRLVSSAAYAGPFDSAPQSPTVSVPRLASPVDSVSAASRWGMGPTTAREVLRATVAAAAGTVTPTVIAATCAVVAS